MTGYYMLCGVLTGIIVGEILAIRWMLRRRR